jgi:hypothetical protein
VVGLRSRTRRLGAVGLLAGEGAVLFKVLKSISRVESTRYRLGD